MPSLTQQTVILSTVIPNVDTDGSVVNSQEGVALSNDEDSPGANQVYGTNASGVKGWQDNISASATALVDGATMDLTTGKHTLASSSATRTFTISYTGDNITLVVTLSATSATYTFPATALCVSEGTASGDNTLSLSGVSGDKYIIAITKVGSAYYVVSKNFGQ